MTDYSKYINALRKCVKEYENDVTFTGDVVVSTLCRDTADLLENLEQKFALNKLDMLDKIKAEIKQNYCELKGIRELGHNYGLSVAVGIVDKYMKLLKIYEGK